MTELLFDPLFRLPFVTGLLVSITAAIVGLYLRLRSEWLAALGFAHLAGAGGLLGVIVGVAPLTAALLSSCLAVGVKGALRRSGNDVYAWMILAAWAVMLLAASWNPQAKMLGDALVDGQLYFVSHPQLLGALGVAILAGVALPLLSRTLLRQHFFPGHDAANGRSTQPYTVGFDLVAAASVAVTTLVMGVMAAFALVFLPPWIAYAAAKGWRWAVFWTAAVAAVGYSIAFVGALVLDLPFGPVLVATLIAATSLRLFYRGGRAQAY